jgi:hypothetical protein
MRHKPFKREGRLTDPVVVGVSGNRLLLAERADVESGEYHGDAQVYDPKRDEWTPIIMLQVWYKWNLWEAPPETATGKMYDANQTRLPYRRTTPPCQEPLGADYDTIELGRSY